MASGLEEGVYHPVTYRVEVVEGGLVVWSIAGTPRLAFAYALCGRCRDAGGARQVERLLSERYAGATPR
jgi:hypothetical protein